ASPSVSLNDPGQYVRGTVTLSSSASDSGSGLQGVTYQYSPSGSGTWHATAADWDTTALADGLYDVRATATDLAGNTNTSTITGVQVDNTAATDYPGTPLTGTLSLSATTADAGSGVDTLTFEHSPAGQGQWTATPAGWDTTGVSDGLYDLRVIVTDRAGNQTTSAAVTDRNVDNT